MEFPSPQDILKKIQGGSTSQLFSENSPTNFPSPQDILTKTQSQNKGPSFLSNIATKAKDIYLGIGKALYKPLEDVAYNKGRYDVGMEFTPQTALEGTKLFGNGVVAIAKGFNEGVARIVKSTATATLGEETTKKIADAGGPISIGKFSEDITGKKDLATYQEIYKKAKSYALDNNASIDQADAFGGLTVLGALFVDNPLMGPGKGSVFKLTEESVARIAKEESEDVIKGIIRSQNPALTDTEIDAMTPVFRNATTPEEVRTLTDQIKGIQNTPLTKQAGDELPTPNEVLDASRKNFEVPTEKLPTGEVPEPNASYFRAIEDSNQSVKFIPVEGKAVRIADNLETFVHQPENGAFEVLEASTGRKIGSVAETPEAAVASAKAVLEGKAPEEIQQTINQFVKETGVTPRESQNITPGTPEAIRAAERGIQPTGAPRPFDQNLIRDLSRETELGPILERMQRAFPRLSEQALTPIAKRVAQLKRTGDIEGILQVMRNIDEDIARSRKAGNTTAGISKDAFTRSIATVGKREAVGDLPPSIGELLTPAERGKYLDNIQRVVKTPDEAVLAQQEYDALWEHADQRIIDRYEELRVWRDILRENMNLHVGKQVNDLYKGTFVSPDDISLAELIRSKPGRDLDGRIDALMGSPGGTAGRDAVEEGQKALEDFRGMREQLKSLEDELREVRPKARAARILQSMVEDVPVISRKQAGDIESLASGEDVRNIYKDISGFQGQAKDVYRNFERVFGSRFKDVKRVILDPFDKSKGDMVDEIKTLGDRIEENVINKYGIKRGSKDSEAVQLYGEGAISQEDLVKMVGSKRVEDIMGAVAWFRDEYDRLLDEVNAIRAQIFPNDPSKLIPKRKDYFRHFQELSDGFRQLIDIFETPAGIDPKLAGLSEWTKPKSKFLGFAQERLGDTSTVDAVGGFLDYAPSFAYAKHIDPHIGNFRYLRRRLAEVSPTPGTKEIRPTGEVLGKANAQGEQEVIGTGTKLEKQEGINNFLTFLDDYANDLAGKTNPMDRYLQKVVPGGRKTMKAIDWTNNRVKANTILGNFASSIAQIFNVPNSIASAKLYSLPGIQRSLSSIFVKDDAMVASSFLKERYKQDLNSRFKIDWVNHPVRATSDQAKEFAVWMIGALDEVGTRFTWQSHYAKALGEGIENPIKYADDMARKMVAGRGVGEVPLLQKSKLFKVAAPFQLEVANAWYVLGDFINKKEFGAIATLFVANYLFNRAAEKVRGTPVVYDPIEAIIDGATNASDEMDDSGNASRAAYKFAGRQVGEILSNVPFGQTVAQALPDNFVKDTMGLEGGKKELFGTSDPGRFGGGLLAMKGVSDPLYKVLFPFAGGQIKKTKEGIEAMISGDVKSADGKLLYKTDKTLKTVIQAVLFGKNGTSESQMFFDARNDLFQRTYRQDAARSELNLQAEKQWADIKDLPNDEKVKKLQALDDSNPTLGEAIYKVAKDEATGLDGTDRLVKMLGVDNGERAKYIVDSITQLSKEEKIAFLQNLDDKKLIPDKVFEQITQLVKGETLASDIKKEGEQSSSSVIDKVVTYAKAMGTDPVTAFQVIFSGQTIRRIDNDTIIVNRMSLSDSEAEKKTQAGGGSTQGMNLDHTIPLQLGGTNSAKNLKLVPESVWASYTPVENALGRALRDKKIDKKTAQDLITKFKNEELTEAQVMSQIPE